MLKVHYQTDHEDLVAACDGHMWQLFEDKFVKSAASDIFTRDELREHAPDKDHFMLHLIAMGDHECYGPNKNADTFSAEALTKYANTFVTHGCFFREHRNRNQETEGIGTVKAAKYNPDMHRVEIVLHGHKKKAAEEYELAKSGSPLSFSMSCRVPFDVANCCGHKASRPSDYCSHMKEQRLQYVPEMRKYAFVFNTKPTFFDISRVRKPADRIAHYLEYRFPDEGEREKAASINQIISGTEWAEYEGVCVPDEATSKWPVKYQAALEKLAAAEKYLADTQAIKEAAVTTPKAAFAKDVAPYAFQDRLDDSDIDLLRNVEFGELVGELAKRASLLPFPEFASLVTGVPRSKIMDQPIIKSAALQLPRIIEHLMGMGLPGPLSGMFDSGLGNGAGKCDPVQQIMNKADEKFNIGNGPVRTRVIQITIKSAHENSLSIERADYNPEIKAKSQAIAEAYGVYKVAAMTDIMKLHGNDIDEPQFLLAVSQNKFIYR